MSVEINGTTGITTPGMESTAMPTVGGDAVVESGSNSDGEWTRLADGTQVCLKAHSATYAVNTAWGSGYISAPQSAGPWPVPFTAPPRRSLSLAVAGEGAVCLTGGPGAEATGADAGAFQLMRLVGGSAIVRQTDIIGQGYWK